MSEELSKFFRCRHSYLDLKSSFNKNNGSYICLKDNKPLSSEECCETCEKFCSRFIEYPITVSKIKTSPFIEDKGLYSDRIGEIVKVKPCAEEYDGKTFVGILLGELPIASHISHNHNTNVLTISPHFNPAIFVPELKKIIYGNESWWGTVSKDDDLSDLSISEEDINNIWYLKLLKEIQEKNN
jgi:hypothetical protein